MRLRLFSPFVLLFPVIAAHADTFTITGTNVNLTFSILASPMSQYSTDPTVDGEAFWIDPVLVTLNGQTGNKAIDFYTTKAGGGLSIEAAGQGNKTDKGTGLLLDTGGLQLFTGTLAAPTFTLGTFTLVDESSAYGSSPTYKGNFLLTIAADPTPVTPIAPTPEPSSLALLGTGVLGLVGITRKRSV